MRTTLLSTAVALAFSFIAGAAEPPVKFLQTDIHAWQSVLATEITADFRAATIREVIASIGRQSRANIVLSLDPSLPPVHAKGVPSVTRQFRRVPLWKVLYQLGQDTGLTIDWLYENSLPRAIRILN